MPPAPVAIRTARADEIPILEALIERSARGLSRSDYGEAEIEALIAHIFGVDSEVVEDGTYLVAEIDGQIAGCGGWSRRRTLFGRDRFAARDDGLLDPATDAARIRAFFVDPAFARRGVGKAILAACETEAAKAGFRELTLMATLPGLPFYAASGFIAGQEMHVLAADLQIRFCPMKKSVTLRHT
jgi:N-acetylglutamate synthase-like GNAT family acetyltransferase